MMPIKPALIATLAVLNLPAYYLLYRLIFDSWDEFIEAVRFWLTPDIISAFRGEWGDDFWAEMKLGLFLTACSGTVMIEAFLVAKYLIQR